MGALRLMTSAAAAKAIGLSRRTFDDYVRRGWITPSVLLPSGQHRWEYDDLKAQITSLDPHGGSDPE